MLQLKSYQENSLSALREYFTRVLRLGALGEAEAARLAFLALPAEERSREYRAVPGLEGMPYVCLRVPTGGGKTLLACEALALAATEYLHSERPFCLWLVPSKAILTQTLDALRNRQHPYRRTLDARFGGQVQPVELKEALHLTRGGLDGATVILVTTLAALRVDNTEGRKVYEQNGSLMPHFAGWDARALVGLERYAGSSKVKPTLANVLALRRPLVIMDEAHKARTPLSFDTLARFQPAAIIEFTATPECEHNPEKNIYASNIVHHVSASELKAEQMIKLPVRLQTSQNWHETVKQAIARRRELEADAQLEEQLTGEYIRPLMLLQAQPKDEEITIGKIQQFLLDEGVPANQVVVATGTEQGLKDVDLLRPDCEIRFIITVQALQEGWDCAFAYVLCTVAELGAVKAVEQIVGRIMRLPRAARKQTGSLNCSYVFSSSSRFRDTLTKLRDSLVANGFEKIEARENVTPAQLPFAPDQPLLGDASLSEAELAARSISVPQLTLEQDGAHELFEFDRFLPEEWDISRLAPQLTHGDYDPAARASASGYVDVERGRLRGYVDSLHQQLALLDISTGYSLPMLTAWIDRNFDHPDVPQATSALWINSELKRLMEARSLTIDQLAHDRHRLRDGFRACYQRELAAQLRAGYQSLLLEGDGVRVSSAPDFTVVLNPLYYAPSRMYDGPLRFNKHFYPQVIGHMNDEEADCAWQLDNLEQVERWARNVERRPEAFHLQTSTGRFYPDFVAQLTDGRILVVEHKGAHLHSTDDSQGKREIGELWAACTGNPFVMTEGKSWDRLHATVTA